MQFVEVGPEERLQLFIDFVLYLWLEEKFTKISLKFQIISFWLGSYVHQKVRDRRVSNSEILVKILNYLAKCFGALTWSIV